MKFEIHAKRPGEDTEEIFFYDNMENKLSDKDGNVFKFSDAQVPSDLKKYKNFNINEPLLKSKEITHLKIQLGLSCNYSCDYCSQKFVERAVETNKKDIDAFMEKLEALEFKEESGLIVEFWGGEPLVYWKTLKPLAEAIQEKFSSWETRPKFSIITNGSILTEEIIDWLMMMDFAISISHDGPGQFVRGPDPLDDPEAKERILGLYRAMTRLRKPFSFNAMLNKQNTSRKAIYEWFVNLTGDPNVQLGEGGMVDAYEEDGIINSLTTKKEHFDFRKQAFGELYGAENHLGFNSVLQKVLGFGFLLMNNVPADYVGQKCGMDNENTIAVDLRGNVITCQNVSAVETSKNDEPHLGGTLDNYDQVKFTSVTHWSNREECPKCPVLHMCKGACMFLDKKFWDISCANAYSDNVALWALAFTQITGGYIPTLIKGEGLPLDRQDIWGTIYEHKEEPVKKPFPIKIVSEKVTTIDNVSVYGKSRVEGI